MEKIDSSSDCEEEKNVPKIVKKIERKKYLQKTGKSLWMKNKQIKYKTVSLEVSTKSTETSFFEKPYHIPTVSY